MITFYRKSNIQLQEPYKAAIQTKGKSRHRGCFTLMYKHDKLRASLDIRKFHFSVHSVNIIGEVNKFPEYIVTPVFASMVN